MLRTLNNLDLSFIWNKVVESGQLTSEFNAPYDEPYGHWKSGDKILFGITRSDQGYCYSAKNLSTDKVINAAVEEKEIPGTDFRCQLNGYRALRPGGSIPTIGRQQDLSSNAMECRFYCQDASHPLSLLRRTPLAQIRLKNYIWNAYHNAAPLEIEGHFVWVPVRKSGNALTLPHYLQTLDKAVIEDIFLLSDRSTNLVLFFNSLHAGASVNHLHVQTVYRRHPLALEKQQATACCRLYVLDTYPAEVLMFQGIQSLALVSEYAIKLQEIGIPFNLIWGKSSVFLVPRNMDHEITEEFPFDAFSAMDICGKVVTTDRATYNSICKERIEVALRKSTIAASKFLLD